MGKSEIVSQLNNWLVHSYTYEHHRALMIDDLFSYNIYPSVFITILNDL